MFCAKQRWLKLRSTGSASAVAQLITGKASGTRWTSFLWLLCVSFSVSAAEYVKLPLESQARHFAVSEDAKFLLAAHEENDIVSVWNMKTGAAVATIDCPKPRFILSRGDLSFVTTFVAGQIHVISHDDWKVTKTIETEFENLFCLSAPQREHFNSILIGSANTKNEWELNILRIDVAQGKTRDLFKTSSLSLATVDYQGDKYITQIPFNYGPPGRISHVMDFDQIDIKFPIRASRAQHSGMPRLYQTRPGLRWYGRQNIYVGMPPLTGGGVLAELVVPDRNQDVVYLFDGESISCHALDAPLTKLGTEKLPLPPFTQPYVKLESKELRANEWMKGKNYITPEPVATTVDQKLYLVAMDVLKGEILRAELPAFEVEEEVAARIKSNLQKPTGFPEKIPAGRKLEFPLYGHEVQAKYEVSVYSKARDIKVDDKGIISWTPTKEQIGKHRFRITSRSEKSRESYDMSVDTEVVDAALLPVELGGTGEAAIFKKVLANPINTFSLTEDKQRVLIAQEADSRVTVWNLTTGKLEATFSSPSAKHVIHRAGKAYVANFGKGTISVHSEKDGWKLVNQLQTSATNVFFLSAAQGKHFEGTILATCQQDSGSGVEQTIVNEETDDPKKASGSHSGQIGIASYDGRFFVKQPLSGGGIGGSQIFPFLDTKELPKSLYSGIGQSATGLRQAMPGNAWFSINSIVKGGVATTKPYGTIVIPDHNRFAYYELEDSTIKCVALDSAATNLGTRRWARPQINYQGSTRPQPLDSNQHIAVTLGDQLHLLYYDFPTQALYHSSVKAIETNALVEAAAQHQSKSAHAFPATIGVGKEQQHWLFGKELEASYEVVSGPDGVRVSENGLVTWTPAQKDLGDVSLRIRASVGDQSVFVKLTTKVSANLPGEPLAPVATDTPGRHVLANNNVRISYGAAGKSVLAIDRKSLLVLSPDGMTVKKRYPLDKQYLSVIERDDYFVLADQVSIDVLSKDDFEVLKSTELTQNRIAHLVAHPSAPLCYATGATRVNRDDPVRSAPLIEFNETTGKVNVLPRAYGHWLTIDPRGRYLVSLVSHWLETPRQIEVEGNLVNRDNEFWLIFYALGDDGTKVRFSHKITLTHRPTAPFSISPDGKRMTVMHQGHFDVGAKKYRVPSYEIGAKWDDQRPKFEMARPPISIDYHPTLGLVAASDHSTIRLFDLATGKQLEEHVDVPADAAAIETVLFSPSGTHVLIVFYHRELKTRVVQSLPLKLTPDQVAANGDGYSPPPIEKIEVPATQELALEQRAYSPSKLTAIAKHSGERMTMKQIARENLGSVVAVKGRTTSMGVIIGETGYVLTTSRALPPFGDPTVVYQTHDESGVKTRSAPAIVVRTQDHLALLKFKPIGKIAPTSFAHPNEAEAADDILLIACPDATADELNHTVDTGYLRNTGMQIAGNSFLLTSLANDLNREGKSSKDGTPIFSSRGRLIGLAATIPHKNLLGISMQEVYTFLSIDDSLAAQQPSKLQTWVDLTGKFRVEAEFIKLENGIVHLKKASGVILKVPLNRLNANDQLRAKELK